jgi:hypothetical protein
MIPAPWLVSPPGQEVHVDASKATAIPEYAHLIVQEPVRAVGQAADVSGWNKRGNLDFAGTRFTGPLDRPNRNLQLWLTAEGLEA